MSVLDEVFSQISDLFGSYLYDILDNFTGWAFRPFVVVLLTLTVFIPIFCFVLKRVF